MVSHGTIGTIDISEPTVGMFVFNMTVINDGTSNGQFTVKFYDGDITTGDLLYSAPLGVVGPYATVSLETPELPTPTSGFFTVEVYNITLSETDDTYTAEIITPAGGISSTHLLIIGLIALPIIGLALFKH